MTKDLRFSDGETPEARPVKAAKSPSKSKTKTTVRTKTPAKGYYKVVATGKIVYGRKTMLERKYGKLTLAKTFAIKQSMARLGRHNTRIGRSINPMGMGADRETFVVALKEPPLDVGHRFDSEKAKANRSTSKGGRKADISSKTLATAVLDVGAKPGATLSSHQAYEVLRNVAETATDLFDTPKAAEIYLTTADIDGAGSRAFDLIKAGRTASVLARFDELRYGTRG